MRVSFSVMAHPSRSAMVDDLVGQLPVSTTVVYDEIGDRWDTGRRSMLALDPLADWGVVIQDDAILCHDFTNQVRAALASVPDGPVAFYLSRTGKNQHLNREALTKARARGECWVRWSGPWWGVAVAMRPLDIAPMLEWCDGRPDIPNYDRRMARYFESIGRACWYSIPSLVDHRHGPENPSLIEGRSSVGRHALWFEERHSRRWTNRTALLPITDPTPRSQLHTLGHDRAD